MTPYKNPDQLNERMASSIAAVVDAVFEKEINGVIKRAHANRKHSVIAMELRAAAISKILETFEKKSIQQKEAEKELLYRYEPQYKSYPELKEDLRRFYPAPGDKLQP
jgi:ribosome-binding ATPase YchF (GTP1/OBG family)